MTSLFSNFTTKPQQNKRPKLHILKGLAKTKLWHVGLQGYSQSISFTSLLSKNQSPTASAMLCSPKGKNTKITMAGKIVITKFIYDCYSTLLLTLGEVGECQVNEFRD